MALTAKKVYAILKRQISDMEAKLNSPVRYRGTVATADLLPLNPDIGDMYNIESKSIYGEAGMNVAWNGVVWDTMGAPIDMSLYIKSNELADWVKQQSKPTYTAEEIGALPADTKIPSKTSDLQNDSGFLTKIPDNYLSGTDKTLSVSGKAADAKIVGDKNAELSADILNKLNKNQGSENSGKIAGINETGDIVPMFPMGVEYNSETNCLEFGADQKMKLNQGIGLDSSLTKTGYAADAGVVGEVTSSLKEELVDFYNDAVYGNIITSISKIEESSVLDNVWTTKPLTGAASSIVGINTIYILDISKHYRFSFDIKLLSGFCDNLTYLIPFGNDAVSELKSVSVSNESRHYEYEFTTTENTINSIALLTAQNTSNAVLEIKNITLSSCDTSLNNVKNEYTNAITETVGYCNDNLLISFYGTTNATTGNGTWTTTALMRAQTSICYFDDDIKVDISNPLYLEFDAIKLSGKGNELTYFGLFDSIDILTPIEAIIIGTEWTHIKKKVTLARPNINSMAVMAGVGADNSVYQFKNITLRYNETVTDKFEDLRNQINNEFVGKNIVFFGDSRTWYDGKAYLDTCYDEYIGKICVGYQQVFRNNGMNVKSYGISGATSPEISSLIKSTDITGADYIVLCGGVNDFIVGGVELGSLANIGGEFGTNTTYGAWQSAVEHLLENYPTAKLVLVTPLNGWQNGQNLPLSIAEVKKNIATLYSLSSIDLYKTSGINTINKQPFFVDDPQKTKGWYLHLNNFGNEFVGKIMLNGIR